MRSTVTARQRKQLALGIAFTFAAIAASCGADSTSSSADSNSAGSNAGTPVSSDTGTELPSPSVSTVASADGLERAAINPDSPVDELSVGFTNAGFDLMRTQPADANLVFSPLSIGHALLMARGAADDATFAAINETFALPEGMDAHDAWNTLDRAIAEANSTEVAMDGTDTPTVTIADRLWPSASASPDQEWVDLMATHHGAGVEVIDVTDPEGSRNRINSWTSDQTNALIPELLPDRFINSNTALVLTDAIYFKAQWQNVFGKYGPETGPFTLLDGATVDTSYLVHLEQPGRRGTGDGFVGAEIPYLGKEYSMLIIVPEEGRFEEIRQRLSSEMLNRIDTTFTTGPYELRMPEWETTAAINFIEWLTEQGIAPGAFPGMGPGIYLAGAVHGADISVDDIGTEAAAATALSFAVSGPPAPELVVAADKSFFYLVRHVDTGAVLFAGQVTDPAS